MSGIPSWAVKGAKVVCIRDFGDAQTVYDAGIRRKPALGETYTVTDAEEWPEYLAVVLGIVGFPGQAFDVNGFRPVTPRTAEQDVSEHFAHHLKTNVPAGVDA